MQLHILDSPEVNIKDYFEETGKFINEAFENDGKVFVHW
jgi:hypothetical protein